MKKAALIMLLFPLGAFAQEMSPKEVVNFALNQMTNGNVKALLDVTEGSEKRKTQELLDQMNANRTYRDTVLGEYKLLKSFSIEEVTHVTNAGRVLAVVATRWTIKVPLERAPKNLVPGDKRARTENTVYMDYMLEQKGGKWKIISRRNM